MKLFSLPGEAIHLSSNTAGLFSTSVTDEVFSGRNQLRQMLRFEVALSEALESCGVTPPGCAKCLSALSSDFIDVQLLRAASMDAGNVAMPFVEQLTDAVRARDPEAAGYVHWGATSQDVLDTALVLQIQGVLTLFEDSLEHLCELLKNSVELYADTIMPGRTWLQQGPPVTLGLKLAGLLIALRRHQERLRAMRPRVLVVQFGGAVGTLASLGEHGLRVSSLLAKHLDLGEAPVPWHTQRDSLVEAAVWAAMLTGTLGKLARDISLLMQNEVGEVLEGGASGRGGSSTMPHKRNPVASAVVLGCATRAPGLAATMLSSMVQEHERGLGGWHAEWDTLPELFRLASAALARSIEIIEGAEIVPERMAQDLAALGGLAQSEAVSMALAPHIGKQAAHHLVGKASKRALANHASLLHVLETMPEVSEHLSSAQLASLLDPANYLGSTAAWIASVLKIEGE